MRKHHYYKQYFDQIKNELFFKERGPKFYVLNHLADLARRRLRRKLLSIQPRKIKDKTVRCCNQELQWFKKKSKWSVKLPGIDLSYEKKAIFAVTGSGVGR